MKDLQRIIATVVASPLLISLIKILVKDKLDWRRENRRLTRDRKIQIGNFILGLIYEKPEVITGEKTVIDVMKLSAQLRVHDPEFAWRLRMFVFHAFGAYFTKDPQVAKEAMQEFTANKSYLESKATEYLVPVSLGGKSVTA